MLSTVLCACTGCTMLYLGVPNCNADHARAVLSPQLNNLFPTLHLQQVSCSCVPGRAPFSWSRGVMKPANTILHDMAWTYASRSC